MSRVAVIDEGELAELKSTVEYLANELKELRNRPTANAYELLTPTEVAQRYRVRRDLVYDALDAGKLAASRRPGRGGLQVWEIEAAAAHEWWRAFIRGKSNQ